MWLGAGSDHPAARVTGRPADKLIKIALKKHPGTCKLCVFAVAFALIKSVHKCWLRAPRIVIQAVWWVAVLFDAENSAAD